MTTRRDFVGTLAALPAFARLPLWRETPETILVNGDSVRSCLTLAVRADGADITTVEGLGSPEALNALQHEFRENHGLQCGFCTPGMLMTGMDLLKKYPLASDDEIREGLSGNLCRCTGYQNIVAAIRAAAAQRNGTTP